MCRSSNYTPTLVVTYAGPAGDPYWRAHTDVWRQPLLLRHAPPAALAAQNAPRELAPEDYVDVEVHQVMLGGRLYDAAGLNEVANSTCQRQPYWWEGAAGGRSSGAALTTGHGSGDLARDQRSGAASRTRSCGIGTTARLTRGRFSPRRTDGPVRGWKTPADRRLLAAAAGKQARRSPAPEEFEMAQPYIGEIRMFGGNFEPAGWMFCNGQILPINENDSLFRLIGTTYGGDGQSTFALPDLQSRTPIHQGGGFTLAESGGAETVTLTVAQIPPHSHPAVATNSGQVLSPQGAYPATATSSQAGVRAYATPASSTSMSPLSIGAVGGGQPHTNIQPSLAINFIISLFGIFPSQT